MHSAGASSYPQHPIYGSLMRAYERNDTSSSPQGGISTLPHLTAVIDLMASGIVQQGRTNSLQEGPLYIKAAEQTRNHAGSTSEHLC